MFKQVGRYEIKEKLGEGAMAEVYRAHDPNMKRDLAIKILNEKYSADARFRERFQREARAAGKLSHPGIVTMYDIGEVENRPFIAMALLAGIPLDEYMRSGAKLSQEQVISIGIQLGGALDYAHSNGIIHRDIKPSNVILDQARDSAIIADFGIARIEDPDLPRQTQTSEVLGTPQYMSPEQVRGLEVDGRTDLFSTGVLLYQLLSGHKPFEAETLGSLLFVIATEDPVPLEELVPESNPQLLTIIDDLLAKDPEQRITNGVILAERLRQVDLRDSRKSPVGSDSTQSLDTVAVKVEKKANVSLIVVLAAAAGFAGGFVAKQLAQKDKTNTLSTAIAKQDETRVQSSVPGPIRPSLATHNKNERKPPLKQPSTDTVTTPKLISTAAPAPSVIPVKQTPSPSSKTPPKEKPQPTVKQTSSQQAVSKANPSQPVLACSTFSQCKEKYRAKLISKKQYSELMGKLKTSRKEEIVAAKKFYKEDKIDKKEYKSRIKTIKKSYE